VTMTLDDLDWEAGELLVRGQGGQRDRMPLLQDVGEALGTYLCHVRPRCATRRVFLRMKAPQRGFASSVAIFTIVRRALERAGLEPPCKGAHVLRHYFVGLISVIPPPWTSKWCGPRRDCPLAWT
jgi:integrase